MYILKNFDIEMLDLENASKPLVWTTAAVPKLTAEMTFTPRAQHELDSKA